LNNLTSTFVYDPNLSDNNINDKISSINCGRAIICVLIAQHSWFRGARTWLVGKTASGEGPCKKDLTKLPCPAGGSWNDRIYSVAAFTVDPVTEAKLRLGILL
jgi:hypothetical protein